MRVRRAILVVVVLGGVAACGSGGGGGGGGAATVDAAVAMDAGVDAAVAVPLVPVAPARSLATDAERAAVIARLAPWLDAQNRGDWKAFQALYAPRFRGVRHAQGEAVRLDRRAWLRERAALFQRPMRVAITELVAYEAGDRVQVFATVTRDHGRRHTVATANLVLVGSQLVLEEILAPRPAVAAPPTGAAGRDGYGYDHAATIAAMRVAPVSEGAALIAQPARALPPIELAVTEAIVDAVTGRIGAARVIGRLAPDDPLAAVVGQPIVVLDRTMAEQCRGTLGALTVRAAHALPAAVPLDAAAAAVWQLGGHVVAAVVDAPCAGPFVRGPDAAPLAFPIVHNQEIPVGVLQAIGAALGERGAAVEVSAELGPTRAAGFALYTLSTPARCDVPTTAARVLYAAHRDGRQWNVARVATLAGTDPSMRVIDLDGDGALDAILAGAAFVGGRLDVRDPILAASWPAGLRCGR